MYYEVESWHISRFAFLLNSPMRRSKMLASLSICQALKLARWWLDFPLKPVGKFWGKGSTSLSVCNRYNKGRYEETEGVIVPIEQLHS